MSSWLLALLASSQVPYELLAFVIKKEQVTLSALGKKILAILEIPLSLLTPSSF